MENTKKTTPATPETKIVNHGYPREMEIGIVDQTIRFIQPSDTCDKDRYQQLTMTTVGVEFDPKDNTDSFIRMAIGPDEGDADIAPFWSCNGPEELVMLFNEFAKRTGMSCRWKLEKYHVQLITDPHHPKANPE